MTKPVWERGVNAAQDEVQGILATIAQKWPADGEGNPAAFKDDADRQEYRDITAKLREANENLKASQEGAYVQLDAHNQMGGGLADRAELPFAQKPGDALAMSVHLGSQGICHVTGLKASVLQEVVAQVAEKKQMPEREAHSMILRETQAFDGFMVRGGRYLDQHPEAREVLAAVGDAGSLSVAGDAGKSAVPLPVQMRLIERMKDISGLAGNVTFMTTDSAATLSIPTVNDTGSSGEWLGEGGPPSDGSRHKAYTNPATRGQVGINKVDVVFNRYSTKEINANRQWLASSAIPNAEARITGMLATRMARGVNARFTHGQAFSLANRITDPTPLTTSGTVAPTFKQLRPMIWEIDRAYRANAKWMMHESVIQALLNTDVGTADARPAIAANWREGFGMVPTLLGYEIVTNHDLSGVPKTAAANLWPALFGDFSCYEIYSVPSLASAHRFGEESSYATAGLVGWLYQAEYGGNLVEPYACTKIELKNS